MIDSLAHVNVAILRNLLGSATAAAGGASKAVGADGHGFEQLGYAGAHGVERGQGHSDYAHQVHRGEDGTHRGTKRKFSRDGDADVSHHEHEHEHERPNQFRSGGGSVSNSVDEHYQHLGYSSDEAIRDVYHVSGGVEGQENEQEQEHEQELSKEDKAAIRKEKNRLAAMESRKKKGALMAEMRDKIARLEADYSLLESRYQVLEQQ
jgi:hypothetical protein